MNLRRAALTLTTSAAVGALALVAACKGTEPSPEPPAPPSGTNASASAAGAAAANATGPEWKDMTREQRGDYMKHVVLPTMKAKFVAFDAGRFADMKCATCHGAGARDHTFKMPNPELPKLPADAEGFAKLMADEPEMTKFMMGTVEREMASLLGESPYDPKTHEGFGCFECHTPKK